MAALQPVRGTHDLLPDEARRHRHVEEVARAIAERYGYGEISTPIFEFTEVFSRTLGDTSDVVTKEMYTFTDRGGEGITLRPEGTAGVARAFISGGLSQHLPLKLFYRGPMFRHERPQKAAAPVSSGRYRVSGCRQPACRCRGHRHRCPHHRGTGVRGTITCELNTLGDGESRDAYRAALVEYLSGHVGALSKDSVERLQRNPLRVLDSKDEGDKRIVADAPVMTDYLNERSRSYFQQVIDGLTALGVPYRLNPRLVRGLDYYCHTAFEFTTDALGAQGTVLAGGRYDGLIGQMGGPATPGIGWAAGVERLAMLLERPLTGPRPIAVIPGPDTVEGLALAERLRRAGLVVEFAFSGSMGKRMKRANKVGARVAVIMGEEEMARGAVAVRDLDSGAQEEVPLASLEGRLAGFR